MRLIADTLGPMIPSTYFDGNVHSVFERLVNVKLQDGSFISICRNDVPNGPGIIRCHGNNRFNYEDHLSTDDICASRGGILRLGKNFQVDLLLYDPFVAEKTVKELGAEKVELEDQAVVINVQKGIKSDAYKKGRYSVKHESGVHYFHQLLSRYLS